MRINFTACLLIILVAANVPISVCFAELTFDPQVDAIMKSSQTIDEKIKKLQVIEKPDAALALGLIYQLGLQGAKKDKEASAKWYMKAAEKGNPKAQYMIGTYYQGGIGLPMDLEKAAYWYGEAAKNGDSEAGEALAELENYMWLNKTGWVPIDALCSAGMMNCNGPITVTSKTYINHWAGEVVEAYYIKGNNVFSRFRISITWITDKSPYRCGQIIEKRVTDIKDFTSRSFALKRCN